MGLSTGLELEELLDEDCVGFEVEDLLDELDEFDELSAGLELDELEELAGLELEELLDEELDGFDELLELFAGSESSG